MSAIQARSIFGFSKIYLVLAGFLLLLVLVGIYIKFFSIKNGVVVLPWEKYNNSFIKTKDNSRGDTYKPKYVRTIVFEYYDGNYFYGYDTADNQMVSFAWLDDTHYLCHYSIAPQEKAKFEDYKKFISGVKVNLSDPYDPYFGGPDIYEKFKKNVKKGDLARVFQMSGTARNGKYLAAFVYLFSEGCLAK